jgi:hypothetical protein
MTATPIDRALCCGQTCGRTRPDQGECVASTHGRRQLLALEAAGYTVTQTDIGDRWFYPTEDPESSYSNIKELLDDHSDDIVEIGHATVIKNTWHVRVENEESGTEWQEFATQAEAEAFYAALPEQLDDEAPQ